VALVLTDGRVADHDGKIARIAARLGRVADSVSVIDTEDGPVRVGIAAQIAQAAGGTVHPLVEPTFRRAA
jgi:magnesium chelatase subunit D